MAYVHDCGPQRYDVLFSYLVERCALHPIIYAIQLGLYCLGHFKSTKLLNACLRT